MLNYEKLKAFRFPPVNQAYGDREVFLYALALGVGADPLNETNLRYVYERKPRVLPTFAAILGAPGMWTRENPDLGIDFEKMVHGEQRIRFHRPLPISASVVGRNQIGRVVDKGAGKGALVEVIRSVHDTRTDELLATLEYVLFCRADGGFSDQDLGATGDAAGPPLEAPRDRAPDIELDWAPRADAALLYRLCGDRNLIHADPEVAARAGFKQPILHGLATYGIAGAAIIRLFCEGETDGLASLSCRFSSPVFPGETLRIQAWRLTDHVAFRVQVPERGVTAISHGRAELFHQPAD